MLVTLAWLVGLATAAAILLAALLVRGQERIVFQPPRPPFAAAHIGAARVDYEASDGQPLLAWLVGDRQARRLVLFLHGNAEIAAWSIPWADELAKRTGLLVMLAEYRGYAGLPGEPTYAGTALDARAAWRYAVDSLGMQPSDIVLYGFSLGSAIATELATDTPPRALVLQAPLTSARDMARIIVNPALAAVWDRVARVHYDTERRVRELEVPVWVIHGEHDLVIPARMGRRVHEAARRKGDLLIIQRAGHNDLVSLAGERYWEWVGRAVQ